MVEQHLAVNVLGPLNVTNAFLPLLKPMIPAYSISKAAAFNMTQSLRASEPGDLG